MTGSWLGRYARTGQPPGFGGDKIGARAFRYRRSVRSSLEWMRMVFYNLQQKAIISSGEYNVQSGIPMSAVEQYVVDENGNKVAVILPLAEYQHLKEDLHDLAMVAERRDEGTISLAELKKRVM